MVKANIKVDLLDPSSIQKAIDALENRQGWIGQKCKELAKRLAEIGMNEAQVAYYGAINEGNGDVAVRIYETPTGYAIEAYGNDVFFVEFGTGISAGNGYDTSEITPPVSIEPGSYSQSIGSGKFSKDHPYWWYNGKRYTGTRPYMGMYHASKAIKQNIEKVAKEVFES